jgi:hypothetical protein
LGATATIPSRHIVGRIRNPPTLQKPTRSRPTLLYYAATNSMTLPPAFWRIRTSPGHRAGTPPHGARGAISTAVTGASRPSSGTGHRFRADGYWRLQLRDRVLIDGAAQSHDPDRQPLTPAGTASDRAGPSASRPQTTLDRARPAKGCHAAPGERAADFHRRDSLNQAARLLVLVTPNLGTIGVIGVVT